MNFRTRASGKTAGEAFIAARDQALWEHGHRGYTGTIAEKYTFEEVQLPARMTVDQLQEALDSDDTPPGLRRAAAIYNDKWGPALCVQVAPNLWEFMGWASS
jgi:hypothetical protein